MMIANIHVEQKPAEITPVLRNTMRGYTPLSDDEIKALLGTLIAQGWRRLKPECDDPLSALYNQPHLQWTMGWAQDSATVYLLVLDESGNRLAQARYWRFYMNGGLVYECCDKFLNPVARMFRRIMQDTRHVETDQDEFLGVLMNRAFPWEYREHAAEALSEALSAEPAIWQALKAPFFKMVYQELDNTEWPTLDLLKIQRLEHKNLLIKFLCKLHRTGRILTPADQEQLDELNHRFLEAYELLMQLLKPGMKKQGQQVYDQFQRLSENLPGAKTRTFAV